MEFTLTIIGLKFVLPVGPDTWECIFSDMVYYQTMGFGFLPKTSLKK